MPSDTPPTIDDTADDTAADASDGCSCAAWKANVGKVNAPFMLAAARNPGQRGYDGEPFDFCPWCGSLLTATPRAAPALPLTHHSWCDFRLSVEQGEPHRACDCWMDNSEPEPDQPYEQASAHYAEDANLVPLTALNSAARRLRDGQAIHDGAIRDPDGCPRGLASQCAPLSRIASPDFASFMCCGQTNNAPVPTDRLRLCIKSTHATGVDVLVNLDERDAVHVASVLMGGLASLGSVKITATDTEEAPDAR